MFRFILTLALLFSASCKSLQSTPLLISDLISSNNKVHQLYIECLDGSIYIPTKVGCKPEVLVKRIKETQDKAKFFISSDIYQPQGYDIYLQVSLIYFSISNLNEDAYSEAERIAQQFFEVQKSSSGTSLTDARFYWVIITAEHLSFQLLSDSFTLSPERLVDLTQCASEGNIAMNDLPPGPKKIRLSQGLFIIMSVLLTNS